ncbi:MAG: NEW3 domain-containing protein [Candidatus Bathyarchaeota archaeon]
MKLKYKTATIIALFVIALNMVALTPLQAVAAEDGNIHGTVVDSDGSPIYRVKVMAYDSKGGLAATKNTDAKGYFRMALGGTYTLVFEKTGYVTLQKTVKVEIAPTDDPDLDDVKMGNIAMEKTISLSSSVIRRVTSPGITLRLSFTVTNNGDLAENVAFSTSAPQGWETRVLDSIGQIESVLLSKGSQSLYLEIKVPASAVDTGVITLTATGTSAASLVFEVTPTRSTDEVQLHSTYLSISEEQGKTIELPLTVSNAGEVDKTVSLEAEAPSGWTATFKTSTNMVVRSLYLRPGDSISMKIVLKPADGAQIGDYEVVVKALDETGVLDTLALGVSLLEATGELEVISTFTDVTVTAGSSVNFPVAVWNTGEKDALCLLTVPVAPENWKTVFISGDIEVSSLLIAAGESTTVKLKVTPPNSVETGAYVLAASVASDDGAETTLPFNINVAGSYQLGLQLSTLYKTVTIGQSLSFTAKVTNDGQSPVTTVYLEAELPSDWEATITPAQVSSLAPRGSTTFTVEVTTPADTVAGDYLLTLKAYSDQLDSEEIDLRVTTQASNTWGYIGFGLVAVAIVGVYFGFKRFKRR